MRTTLFKYLLFAGIFSATSLPQIAGAREITGITVDPSTAKIASPDGASARITIHADADAPTFCGLQIDFGNGIPSQDIKIDNSEGLFPRVVVRKFTQPGTYTIRVQGKKVTTHLPCPGKAAAVLVVERANPIAPSKPVASETPPKSVSPEQKFFQSWF